MSILKAMQCYATGQLPKLSSDELETMQDVVIEKIDQIEGVLRAFDIGIELWDDLRTYRLIRETIAVELEGRVQECQSTEVPKPGKKGKDPVFLFMDQLNERLKNEELLKRQSPATSQALYGNNNLMN
jgi:ribosomal protein S13